MWQRLNGMVNIISLTLYTHSFIHLLTFFFLQVILCKITLYVLNCYCLFIYHTHINSNKIWTDFQIKFLKKKKKCFINVTITKSQFESSITCEFTHLCHCSELIHQLPLHVISKLNHNAQQIKIKFPEFVSMAHMQIYNFLQKDNTTKETIRVLMMPVIDNFNRELQFQKEINLSSCTSHFFSRCRWNNFLGL